MNKLYVLNGPQEGKSFDLRDDANYIGRSYKIYRSTIPPSPENT